MAKVEDRTIDVAGGTILARIYWPKGAPKAIVDFMHGGGFTIGSASSLMPPAVILRKIRNASWSRSTIGSGQNIASLRQWTMHMPLCDGSMPAGTKSRGGDLPLIVAGDSAGAVPLGGAVFAGAR